MKKQNTRNKRRRAITAKDHPRGFRARNIAYNFAEVDVTDKIALGPLL